MIGRLFYLVRDTILSPCAMFRSARVNLLRSNTVRKPGGYIYFRSYSIADVHPSAKIHVEGHSNYGFKKYRGSRLETSPWMDAGAEFHIGGAGRGVSVYHGCDIQIFKNAVLKIEGPSILNRGAQIICQDSISIGQGCLISRDVVIRDNDGGHTVLVDGYKKTAPVTIGNHVWIGQGALILKGSVIGDGAIIGAGAIVAGRVKANSLVMADPSRTFAKDIKWEP